ncbi:MAG: hypothetical protein H0V04_02320, partial [Chloroflexi bacterium]|nr:hypothetical protein [Chloroflexota bacterium]
GAPLDVWFALAEALDRPMRVEFGRDAADPTPDAGHLAIQELVLRVAKQAGFDGRFEIPTRPGDPSRSTDVRLVDHRGRRLVLVECWNTFGDIGAAVRSADRKRAEVEALAVALGGDEGPNAVGACWVVRATRRNRELLVRYPHIFESRFPGPGPAWVATLTSGGPTPHEPGLIWCDIEATRLFARRRHAHDHVARLSAPRRSPRAGSGPRRWDHRAPRADVVSTSRP